jgi:uncharacterized protein (TIGR03437 family)
LWPAGSKHFIRTAATQPGLQFKTLYSFSGYNTNLGAPGSVWPITVSPGLTYVELDYTVSYAITLSYYPCPNAPDPLGCTASSFPAPGQPFPPLPPAPPSPGEVSVNGTIFWADGEIYAPAGSTVQVEAHPSDGCSGSGQCRGGYIFTGWGLMPGVPPGSTFIWQFPLNQPQVVHPLFQQAQPLQVHIGTAPAGLQILIDRTPVISPVPPVGGPTDNSYTTYYWGWGTDHQVGAIPVQRVNGQVMIFSSWSDGGAINHVYHVTGTGSSALDLMATFVPGAAVSFLTSPPGLTLSIDGRKNWESYNFNWAQGSTHTVSAPPTQTDSQGTLYKFVSWSNGGSADQTYTVANAPDDVRITATYQPVAQVNISSVPPGIVLQADGSSCTTPCTLQRDVGVKLSLNAPAMAPAGDGARLLFQGWADSSSPARSVVTTANPMQFNLTYQLQYQLSTAADPANAVLWTISPASNDGFYNAQSVVILDAREQPGFRFLGWNGDASGITRPVGVSMTAPKTVTVMVDPVPFVDKGGVKNGAGDTPEPIVAPGSVVSVVGINLAPGEEHGPASPLKQSLAGVSVRASGMLMPLFYVSPNQINAQLPFEVSEGPQSLTLSVPGKPDLKVDFTVSRNAPGLFNTQAGDVAYAMASHADGSPVTLDSPAAQGETITLFGTGLGPYLSNTPDGFALPADGSFLLADPLTLVVGDNEVPTLYAGAANQQVGVNAVRFTIDNTMPQGTNVPVKVKINGHVSNTVLLPLK